MTEKKYKRSGTWPAWYSASTINEAIFCQEYLADHKLVFTENAFFTPQGKMTDEAGLQADIYRELEDFACTNVTKKISNIVGLLKISSQVDNLPPETDRIHLANGTLMLDGSFSESMDQIVRCRFPIRYNPDAGEPTKWLHFLNQLLHPEDIPTLQEYVGYCLIPSTAAQKMMVIKGNGGEGKSQIGAVLSRLFGCNAKDGSIGKVSENRFARADLEHVLLMIDDDMRMEALKQTNYIKSLVTAQGKMDLERKGKQSYQGYLYARLLAFSNGDLQALYDRSDGFFRRQLILTTREKSANRMDDPHIADKLCTELEGIFLWAFAGLQRLAANNFCFTESERAKGNRKAVKQDANNLIAFLESKDYIRFDPEVSVSSEELYKIYCVWCKENGLTPLKQRSVSDYLIDKQAMYNIEYSNNILNYAHRRVRGFRGIEALIHPSVDELKGFTQVWPKDNPFEEKTHQESFSM